jgi:pimeloyl-ACP methyl ester carboxylesterase
MVSARRQSCWVRTPRPTACTSPPPPCYRLGPSGARPTGVPLVLLPGIEGDPRLYLGQVPLAERHAVWACGQPGSGSLMARGRALLALVPGRFAVVGLSLGGLVGWAAACQAPERVVGLLAVNTLPGRDLCPAGIARQRQVLRLLPNPVFDLLYRSRIRRRLLAEGVAPWLADALALPSRDTLVDRLGAVLGWDLPGQAPVPTRWLRGQNETEAPWTPADVAERLVGVTVEVIPGGHRAPLTHSATFNQAVLQWAAGLR